MHTHAEIAITYDTIRFIIYDVLSLLWHDDRMFGFGKNKDKTNQSPASSDQGNRKASVRGGTQGQSLGKKAESQGLAGDALRAQALANAKAARAAIGEETLDKIAAAMAKKQKSAMEQAKRNIQNADAERVALEILSMLETRH